MNEFLKSIRENIQPECNVFDNIKTLKMTLAAVESAKTNKIINIYK